MASIGLFLFLVRTLIAVIVYSERMSYRRPWLGRLRLVHLFISLIALPSPIVIFNTQLQSPKPANKVTTILTLVEFRLITLHVVLSECITRPKARPTETTRLSTITITGSGGPVATRPTRDVYMSESEAQRNGVSYDRLPVPALGQL